MDIKAGTVPQAKVERDYELLKDYDAKNEDGSYKYSVTDLVIKYKVGSSRIFQIINKYNVQKRK